jgi:hypothetical protein
VPIRIAIFGHVSGICITAISSISIGVRLQINPTGRQTARRIQLDGAAPAVLVLLSARQYRCKTAARELQKIFLE